MSCVKINDERCNGHCPFSALNEGDFFFRLDHMKNEDGELAMKTSSNSYYLFNEDRSYEMSDHGVLMVQPVNVRITVVPSS